MATKRYFTEEEKSELLSNPYTARITDCKVYYTLAFKKFALQEITKPGMTAAKVFAKAGYRSGLFPPNVMRYTIRKIQSEASSEAGLQETKAASKSPARKKHSETEFRELEQRVKVLEQQIEFLKKSQHIRKTGQIIPPPSSN